MDGRNGSEAVPEVKVPEPEEGEKQMKGIMIIKILAGIALFSAGIAVGVPVCRMYDKARVEAASADDSVNLEEEKPGENYGGTGNGQAGEDLQLRVRDGELEWYDGVRWNSAGAVAQLVAEDPISQPSEAWLTLAAQLAEIRAGEYAEEAGALSRDEGGLSVDETAPVRPQTNVSATPRPGTPAGTRPTAPVNAAPDNNDNNDSNDDNNDDHNDAPAPEPEPAPEPAPEPEPDTGDGENIEWSGDYE